MIWIPILLIGCASESVLKPTVIEEILIETELQVETPKPEKILGSYKTLFEFKAKKSGRAFNIQHVTNKINGVTINPGEIFSFNQVVGPRILENGFTHAEEIFLGEMVDGVGGGTCQVSSTLFAASIFSDLDIIERRSHSRPSKYIGFGLDATVAFPDSKICLNDKNICSDLKFRNPFTWTVKIEAKIDSEKSLKSLTINILGEGSNVKIKTRWSKLQTSPFSKRFRKTGKRLGVYKKLLQPGLDGMEGTLVVQGGRIPHRIPSRYPPVDELWEVGLGWDMNKPPWEF